MQSVLCFPGQPFQQEPHGGYLVTGQCQTNHLPGKQGRKKRPLFSSRWTRSSAVVNIQWYVNGLRPCRKFCVKTSTYPTTHLSRITYIPKLHIFYRIRKLYFAHVICQIIPQPKQTIKLSQEMKEYGKSLDTISKDKKPQNVKNFLLFIIEGKELDKLMS